MDIKGQAGHCIGDIIRGEYDLYGNIYEFYGEIIGLHYKQQADEDIEYRHVQTDGCQNVIGFSTMNDTAGVIQNETAHDQNHNR